MSRTAKPILHGRDHEHGGANPTRIVYEDVGTGGSGGGVTYDGTLERLNASTNVSASTATDASLSHLSGATLCSSYGTPVVATAGIYSLTLNFSLAVELANLCWAQALLQSGIPRLVPVQVRIPQRTGTGIIVSTLTLTCYLAAGDYFEVQYQHNWASHSVSFSSAVYLQRLL